MFEQGKREKTTVHVGIFLLRRLFSQLIHRGYVVVNLFFVSFDRAFENIELMSMKYLELESTEL